VRCHERGDYRMRRSGFLWVIERKWPGGWTRIGLRMRYATAHAVFHEFDDWQVHAGVEAQRIMRGEASRRVRLSAP
jgi:hypothetical protein